MLMNSKSNIAELISEMRKSGIHWYKVICPGGFKLIATADEIMTDDNVLEIDTLKAMEAWHSDKCLNWLQAFRMTQTFMYQVTHDN